MSRHRDFLRPRRLLRLAVLTAALVAAVVAGFVTSGRAASVNTCDNTTACFKVAVVPGMLSPDETGLVVARFQNQGSATANHTVITVTAPAQIVDGATVSAKLGNTAVSVCSPATINGGDTTTCNFGTVPGHGVARVFVQFTAPHSGRIDPWQGSLAFDEGGKGNDTNGNDTFPATSGGTTTTDGTSQLGVCGAVSDVNGLNATGSNGQQTKITSVSADGTGLPCTAATAGVTTDPAGTASKFCGGHPCVSQVSFASFPVQPSSSLGKLSVLIPASLFTGPVGNIVLYEYPIDAAVDANATGIALKKCPTIAAHTDSCIENGPFKTKVGTTQYVRWDLQSTGSPADGRYGG